jgi:hypothetical protein
LGRGRILVEKPVGTFGYNQRKKIELSKDVDATKLTLDEVQEMIAKKTPR